MENNTSNPPTRPMRLLSIDGGGLKGLIPAEALIAIETQLDALTGRSLPLSDRFDLIGGTSTGAILAVGLALGLKAAELRDFYLKFGKQIFTKVFLTERFWHSYPSGPLEQHLKDVFGEGTTLGSGKLRTNILIVSKNVTLGTTWFFTNNPKGKYFANNQGLPLWQIVRASSAAPTYFPPQTISVPDDAGQVQHYEFIDGGVSSYNNPSMQVFLEATDPTYQFGWPTGAGKLLLLSLGTGFNAIAVPAGKASGYNLLDWARYAIKELMDDANLQQNVLMHLIGQPPTGKAPTPTAEASAARAIGVPAADALDFISPGLGAYKALTYQRITVSLTRKRLDGLNLGDIDPAKAGEMDAVDQIGNFQRIGQAIAKEQVRMDLVKQFFV
ncbi:MAG TPA: patatin-like phospholipase family protein [Terriglobales bacterium]|nr:patatin-like phospholipase family protein [Terriglobales bacterium]